MSDYRSDHQKELRAALDEIASLRSALAAEREAHAVMRARIAEPVRECCRTLPQGPHNVDCIFTIAHRLAAENDTFCNERDAAIARVRELERERDALREAAEPLAVCTKGTVVKCRDAVVLHRANWCSGCGLDAALRTGGE